MNTSRLMNLVLAAGLACGTPILAQKGKHGSEKAGEGQTVGEKVREALPPTERIFKKEEIAIIRDYFRINRSGLPPGLAKRDRLPPGLEKQLRRNGSLPPGLQKKVQFLPPVLEKKLRLLPTGYRRVFIAGHVILMSEKTARIYDIVRNVIP